MTEKFATLVDVFDHGQLVPGSTFQFSLGHEVSLDSETRTVNNVRQFWI